MDDDDSNDGFDWSAIDAAIEAVLAGNWTTYGDLAELGGTAAVPVGAYCASSNAPAAAYRVLTNRGEISAGFRWTDPADTRDVRTVLEEEGVRFNAQGAADQSQRLRAPDLQALLDSGPTITWHKTTRSRIPTKVRGYQSLATLLIVG